MTEAGDKQVRCEQPTVTLKVYLDYVPSFESGVNVEIASMTFREEAATRDLDLLVRSILSKLNVVTATERLRNRLP